MNALPLIRDLLVVLGAGLCSGVICKRFHIPLLVGYLVTGALVGYGGLQLVSEQDAELQGLAEAGALLLLFAVGIEFSFQELAALSRYFLLGGIVQMLLVAIPLAGIGRGLGLGWNAAILAAFAGALSSTVLVFRSLSEVGQISAPHGRRAVGILLFQDVALVPLLLLVPLLTGRGEAPALSAYGWLGARSALFVLGVWGLQWVIARYAVRLLADLRSVELIVLFSLCVLGSVCTAAHVLGLPAAVGALAAGIVLSGNRLSKQIDTIVLPFRETFAAVFFVTLGMLMRPLDFFREPVLLTAGLMGIVLLKTCAAAIALRVVGMGWRPALGMGMGLSQLGEFGFLLISEGMTEKIISAGDYNRMLLIGLGSLILTPLLLRKGLQWTTGEPIEPLPSVQTPTAVPLEWTAVVIGIGPIGKQVASRLETMGAAVCLVDLSPVNLYPFGQSGFRTVAGDARDLDVLRRAQVEHARLVVVCVPADEIAVQVCRSVREVHPGIVIVVRCRFQASILGLRQAGADRIISEEEEASGPLLRVCEAAMGHLTSR